MRKPIPSTNYGLFSAKTWSQTLSWVTSKPPSKTSINKVKFDETCLSPTRIIAHRLRSKHEHQKDRYKPSLIAGVSAQSERPPILLLRNWLARQDLSSEDDLSKAVKQRTHADWKDSVNIVRKNGWSEEDLEEWIAVVSAEDGDARVQRFVSTDRPKPMFLLLLLLRRDEVFHKPELLASLIRYAKTHHMQSASPDAGHGEAPPKHGMIMNPAQFSLCLRRLVFHASRTVPQIMVDIARLVEAYIRAIPFDVHHKHHTTDYSDQCLVFNNALEYFTIPVPGRPLDSMQYNWDAQKILLAMADRLPRRLIIKQSSYRAIRKVLGGLRKSEGERETALRYAVLWPPYRQDFDGTDAKRTIESDRSRSAQAGVLMRGAGYAGDDYDRALDALGGTNNGSPTIHTRSLPPGEWRGELQNQNTFIDWAMNVRATRNAQEAWRIFNQFAEKTGLSPNFQVYTEMIVKLLAEEIETAMSPDLVPGESIETFPVPELNYSEYELARLSPPTVSQLYDDMINHGIKPTGHGLNVLVRNAASVGQALRFIEDSGFVPTKVVDSMALFKNPTHRELLRLRPPLFESYIKLLCRLQPRYHNTGAKYPESDLQHIQHAINLVSTRLNGNTVESKRFRTPWQTILSTLASSSVSIVAKADGIGNDMASLTLFVKVLRSFRTAIGIDVWIFFELCRVIAKAALSRLRPLQRSERARSFHMPGRDFLLSELKQMFSEFKSPINNNDRLVDPQFQHPLGPQHLHAYMRALALLDSRQDMIDLMFWILDHHEIVKSEVERIGNRGARMLARTICAFEAFAGPALEVEVQDELRRKMILISGSWRWPTPEEVDDYCMNDFGMGASIMRRKVFGSNPTLS
ncbi:hypothetical protein F5Y16DRAFT_271270 [Xylariaceae sp. FL0255]|nr:hypothetical protein F5Y16DRAFT_271270 [Xylariaceae sp. FL0255]